MLCSFWGCVNGKWVKCDQEAVAVYVSDDSRREMRPVCAAHRDYAVKYGDGSVYALGEVLKSAHGDTASS